ncbi:MAG: DNA translocase FtsK [Oscillospiraceae bacterium]|nr:DNA translocase FtsK [Oscillospiraceae bacterium]
MSEGKKATKRQTKAQKETAKAEALARDKRRRHIYSVVLFAAGLLLFAFAVLPLEETAWTAVRSALSYIFGSAMYIVGLALIYMAVKRRVILLTLIVSLVCALLHIIGDFGGIVGYGVSYLPMFFGRVGAGIIIALIIFVLVMIMGNITLDAFLKFVASPFAKVGVYAKQQRELHRQDAEYLEESRRKLLQDTEQEKYSRMKAAEKSIKDEISRVPPFPPLYSPPFEPELDDEYEDSPQMPPQYISPSEIDPDSPNNEEEPPFDIERVNENDGVVDLSNEAFDSAIENYKKEEDDEERERESREKALEEPAPAPVSDFDAITKFAEHQQMYSLPGIDLLDDVVKKTPESDIQAELDANSEKLVETLKSFGVLTTVIDRVRGPSVTRYEIQPARGVKISKITALTDDIALNLAAAGVRMEAPIPGKSAVGVEVPNAHRDMVTFRELVGSKDFGETESKLGAVIGRDITGEVIISDITKMPHLLIAGTTGSGKSVCVNSIIMSILYRATPEEVRLMMIDPKMVEFAIYSGIPHLLTPVVTDPKKAAGSLGWAVNEMTQRYTLFAENNVRNIGEFNEIVKKSNDELESMAKIVIFIDELADLMMTAAKEVEGNICRLAQLARAAGIHLVIATQRPTTNVVTGLIKANIPSRIGLKVASQVDSRVIFDTAGAEKLLGNGDMLYAPTGIPKPIRVQGCWVSNDEINRVVKFVKDNFDFEYDENVIEEIERQTAAINEKDSRGGDIDEDFDLDDDKLEEAIEAVIDAGKASTSYLQLKLKLGYGRAARLIDVMERMGVIGKSVGSSRPREVLMTREDWLERKLLK